ncbi:hypothetical protein MYP_5020 [Sporocytophaga myxococcoides]|uniref:Uncharacterized protein n=1 Tax=Sporocytophaga myxococcoides TaxID=153721 RepID=A0A098LMR4_9BACT|nr:hypothetical protein [Sporocytophaga myxococcoides]GAL87789.1 hypothetical protein MYP_5020 [Sporocytophaga myxococcoides]
MDEIKSFEDSLNKADQVHFHLTRDYNKEPSAIKLGFKEPKDGIHGYGGIHTLFKNLETILVIFMDNSDNIDLSIVSKQTASALNIKNLKFDKLNLEEYLRYEPKDRKLIILIGPNPSSDFNVVLPQEMTSPLVLDKYSTSQRQG